MPLPILREPERLETKWLRYTFSIWGPKEPTGTPIPEELDEDEELEEIVSEINEVLIEEVVKEPVVIEEISVDAL